MNTSVPKTKGVTLVEMLIVIAIIGILSTIAYPSYVHYIERGYQSQAHAELLDINNGLKTKLVKNPALDMKAEVDKVKNHQAAPEITARYDLSGEMKDSSKTRAYYLFATPKSSTGYKLSVWMDSLGNAYKCTDAASAKAKLTGKNGNTGCEPVGNTKSK